MSVLSMTSTFVLQNKETSCPNRNNDVLDDLRKNKQIKDWGYVGK
jgi:hypothetical protein